MSVNGLFDTFKLNKFLEVGVREEGIKRGRERKREGRGRGEGEREREKGEGGKGGVREETQVKLVSYLFL